MGSVEPGPLVGRRFLAVSNYSSTYWTNSSHSTELSLFMSISANILIAPFIKSILSSGRCLQNFVMRMTNSSTFICFSYFCQFTPICLNFSILILAKISSGSIFRYYNVSNLLSFPSYLTLPFLILLKSPAMLNKRPFLKRFSLLTCLDNLSILKNF